MPLLTIADLDQPEADLAPYIRMAEKLGGIYQDYIASSQNDTYKYEVEIFGSGSRKPGIHASEISKCQRLVVYSIRGTQKVMNTQTTDPNMLMRFKLGHAVHAMIQNDWHRIADKSEGTIQFEDEVRVSPQLQEVAAMWDIYTSCDGIITLLQDGVPVVRVGLEIKTESGPQYDKLNEPRKDHKEQTTVYQATLDLPLMWVFYYNKSNSNYTEAHPPYLFKFDKRKWEQDLEMRFAKAHHMAETGQLPDREEGMQCRWCPYSYACRPKILGSSGRAASSNPGMRSPALPPGHTTWMPK